MRVLSLRLIFAATEREITKMPLLSNKLWLRFQYHLSELSEDVQYLT